MARTISKESLEKKIEAIAESTRSYEEILQFIQGKQECSNE